MMMDIFSSFDPAINSLNNASSFMFWLLLSYPLLLLLINSIWAAPSPLSLIMFNIINIINTQSNRTSGKHIKGFNNLLVSLFILVIMVNLVGLLPAAFSYSSHLMFTLSLGLPMWLTLIISAMLFDTSSWAAALLPGGAPDWLNPFLVIIETISILVRPLTLSFRLAANMSAGHIVLALLGSYAAAATFSSIPALMSLFIIQVIYIMFEMGICLIQAYIFCLLLSLYADDHPLS